MGVVVEMSTRNQLEAVDKGQIGLIGLFQRA